MKRIVAILLGGLLLLAMVHSAFAWEFTMKGEFEYRYRFFERMGSQDLYGNAKLQDAQGQMYVGMAGPSFYEIGASRSNADANAEFAALSTNNVITRGGFSRWSSDARITDMKLTLLPTIKVNDAIEIYLALNIGGFRNKYAMWRNDAPFVPIGFEGRNLQYLNNSSGVPPLERYYMSQSSDAATNTASLISVDEFKFAFQIPWGMFSFGTKNFPLGTGATFARNTREESIYMLVPYGPLNMRFYLFPTEPPRVAGPGSSGAGNETDVAFTARGLSGWGTGPDGETKSRRFVGGVIQYLAGSMDFGAGLFNRKVHMPRGYSGQIRYGAIAASLNPLPPFNPILTFAPPGEIVFYQLDRETFIGLLWGKFNNGRFFANGEYALADSETLVSNVQTGTVTGLTPLNESVTYHAFAEIGVFSGPAKLSLMGAQSSGNVWSNYGWLLGPGGTGGATLAQTGPGFGNFNYPLSPWRTRGYGLMPINYQVLEPYNYLMFNTYGGGNSVFNADGTGEMGDARALAARLDYAVAANLNVYGTFMYAKRLERHGYFAGQFGTRDQTLSGGVTIGGASTPTNVGAAGNFNPGLARAWKAALGFPVFESGAASPWIDNDFIGWEANAGVTWQLLEGLTTEFRYAYWQPGEWFEMAYKAYNGGLRADPVSGTVYGADLMRGRSPIQAVKMSATVSF